MPCLFLLDSVCLSVCLSACRSVGRSVGLSVRPSVCLSGLSVCLAALLSSLQFPSLDAQLRVISTNFGTCEQCCARGCFWRFLTFSMLFNLFLFHIVSALCSWGLRRPGVAVSQLQPSREVSWARACPNRQVRPFGITAVPSLFSWTYRAAHIKCHKGMPSHIRHAGYMLQRQFSSACRSGCVVSYRHVVPRICPVDTHSIETSLVCTVKNCPGWFCLRGVYQNRQPQKSKETVHIWCKPTQRVASILAFESDAVRFFSLARPERKAPLSDFELSTWHSYRWWSSERMASTRATFVFWCSCSSGRPNIVIS